MAGQRSISCSFEDMLDQKLKRDLNQVLYLGSVGILSNTFVCQLRMKST